MSEVDRPGYPGVAHRTVRAPAPPPPKRHPPGLLAALLIAVLVAIAVGVGQLGWHTASTSSLLLPRWAPYAGLLPESSVSKPSGSVDLAALAAKVDPALVDINAQLAYQNGEVAGTGIVLTPSGEVLTNNHVISGATSISVTDVGNGQIYPATVVGYDRSHDIAVLQLQGASGLQTASIGDSDSVAVGDQVAAIGNAGGRGGTPSTAAGTVSALHQTVTVSDDNGENAQQLTGLIQVVADVQPGDSGGPLVSADGDVIGLTTAGSGGPGSESSGGVGLAIPIDDAIEIGKQIDAGNSTSTVHIGPTGVLGIEVQVPTSRARYGGRNRFSRPSGSAASGVIVASVMPGSPGEHSGLAAGDVIVSFDGAAVDSPTTLTTLLTGHHPGDLVQVAWVDSSGQQQDATVRLTTGPPN